MAPHPRLKKRPRLRSFRPNGFVSMSLNGDGINTYAKICEG